MQARVDSPDKVPDERSSFASGNLVLILRVLFTCPRLESLFVLTVEDDESSVSQAPGKEVVFDKVTMRRPACTSYCLERSMSARGDGEEKDGVEAEAAWEPVHRAREMLLSMPQARSREGGMAQKGGDVGRARGGEASGA